MRKVGIAISRETPLFTLTDNKIKFCREFRPPFGPDEKRLQSLTFGNISMVNFGAHCVSRADITVGGEPTQLAETAFNRKLNCPRCSGVEAKNPCTKVSARTSVPNHAESVHGSRSPSPSGRVNVTAIGILVFRSRGLPSRGAEIHFC